MKKLVSFMPFTVLCILLLMICLLTGCSGSNQPADSSRNTDYADTITPELSKINMPFELERNEKAGKNSNMYTICYSGKDCFIVANVYDNITTATEIIYPETRTVGLYMVKYDDENTSTFYNIKSQSIIYSAVPYRDGILYVESKASEKAASDENYAYEWSVIYHDGKKQKTIDSGYSKNEFAAQLVLIDDIPVYVCEKVSKDGVELSVNKITEFETKTIDSMGHFENYNMFETNGKTYLLDLYDRDNEKTLLVAGDAQDINIKHTLSDKLNSCSITENYIVASLGEDPFSNSIEGIPIDDSKDKKIPQIKQWWRMTGAAGKYCMAVDDGFNPYYINIEDGLVGEIRLPDEMESNTIVRSFHAAGKDRFILGIDYTDYYIMDLS